MNQKTNDGQNEKKAIGQGIPSKYSLCIKHQEVLPDIDTMGLLSLNDFMLYVFPEEYQPKLHDIARGLMSFVLDKNRTQEWVTSEDMKEFYNKTGHPPSTTNGSVIPKLVEFGLLDKVIETGRGNPMKIKKSQNLSRLLRRLSDSWYSLIAVSKEDMVVMQE